MYTVVREEEHSFWIESSTGETFPADFMFRDMAEYVCTLLNRDEKLRAEAGKEKVNITLEVTNKTPRESLGGSPKSKQQRVGITLDGYAKPVDKTLTVKAKDDEPAPAPKPEKIKFTL